MTISPLNPALGGTFAPPVMAARRWLEGVTFAPDRPLMNVSQAAPTEPPPAPLRQAMAEAALHDDEAHLYGPVLGLPALRQQIAAQWSRDYGGALRADQIAITQGCNQAFCAALATLAGPGDQVILPVPWYFNHRMWLDMAGIGTQPLPCADDGLPDPDRAAALITDRSRAIVLITPNNPTGAEYPADLMRAFFDLCRERGLALIVDETYRDFHSVAHPGGPAPHDLFSDPDWDDTLIQLYSFSKAFRLTGHRVGAIATSSARQAQVEKFLDTVAICPGQLGQIGALYGMQHLGDWLAGERAEILARGQAARAAFGALPGWRLKSCGAYFAWVEHPFDRSAADLAPHLVRQAGVLALPGSMFTPDGDAHGARHFRFAFANMAAEQMPQLAARLAGFAP